MNYKISACAPIYFPKVRDQIGHVLPKKACPKTIPCCAWFMLGQYSGCNTATSPWRNAESIPEFHT